jgi:DNA polymerase-1
VTGDKDMMQLVNDKVKLYMPQRSLKDAKLFGRDEVLEKMGVEPGQIVDLKALTGDPSDNYKGVPGIGPKTAQNLLGKYKTFERTYQRLDEVPEATKQKLESGRGSGELSRNLRQLVPIEFDISELEGEIDNPRF